MLSIPEISAILEVQRLKARYVQAVDAGDADGVAAVFAEDAVFDGLVLGRLVGRAQIRDFFAARELPSPARRHYVSSMNARLDDDGVARMSTYLFVPADGTPSGPDETDSSAWGQTCGWYEDEFEQINGEWLIRRSHLHIEIFRGLEYNEPSHAAGS